MHSGNSGNISKEVAEQRLRDSPLHNLKTCTHPVQNQLIEKSEDLKNESTDFRETD